MRRLTLQWARWYQPPSTWTPPRPGPVFPKRAFSAAAQRAFRRRDKIKEKPMKVTYYEQDTLENVGSRKFLGEEMIGNATTAEELREEIADLDRQLEEMKKGPFGEDTEFMRSLDEEGRQAVREAVAKAEAKAAAEDAEDGEEEEVEYDIDEDSNQINFFELEMPDKYYPYIEKLNTYIRRAEKDKPDSRAMLWKYYYLCRQSIPDLLQFIPLRVWQILWQSQNVVSQENPDRWNHMAMMGDDMRSVDRQLEPVQVIDYIECLYSTERVEDAFKVYEDYRKALTTDTKTVEDYLELGIRIYADQGHAEEAEKMAGELLDDCGSGRWQVLIGVIAAYVDKKTEAAMHRAWAAYLQLLVESGGKVSIEYYDTINHLFLRSGRADLAFAVFRDMMVGSDGSDKDSAAIFRSYTRLLSNALLNKRAIADEINNVSLETLAVLPRRYHNKYFFGMWLKRLIGNNELDSAALVIELMYERGVRPEPKHLNGLIGAWFRIGDKSSKQKAETMAWTMVNARIKFVKERRRVLERQKQHEPQAFERAEGEASVQQVLDKHVRVAPSATSETFCVLLLSYIRRGMIDQIPPLVRSLEEAELKPNIFFLNHLLRAELQKWDVRRVWEIYLDSRDRIQPDTDTFFILWKACEIQEDTRKSASWHAFPSVKELFKHMVDHFNGLGWRDNKAFVRSFEKLVYEQIIQAVCKTSDIGALIGVINGLARVFSKFPDQDTARRIVFRLSRIAPLSRAKTWRKQRRLKDNPGHKEELIKAIAQLHSIINRRYMLLEERGMPLQSMSEDAKYEEHLLILSELLRQRLERVQSWRKDKRVELNVVARDMGIPDVVLHEPLELSDKDTPSSSPAHTSADGSGEEVGKYEIEKDLSGKIGGKDDTAL